MMTIFYQPRVKKRAIGLVLYGEFISQSGHGLLGSDLFRNSVTWYEKPTRNKLFKHEFRETLTNKENIFIFLRNKEIINTKK